MRITIIGYGPAAVKAIEAIEYHARLDPGKRLHVTVISHERAKPYAPMFLIKYITGQIARHHLLLRPPGLGFTFPFQEILGRRAVRILEEEKKVLLDDGQEITFDKLLIAGGASPIFPPVRGLDNQGIFTLSRFDDAEKISHALKGAAEVVIVGAGAMGIEAAIAFNAMGKKVRVVELLGQILPQTLDPELAQYVQRRLESLGIEFFLGNKVSEIAGDSSATGVLTQNGQEVHGTIVLITAGVRPNTDLLKSTGIRTDRGIIVNERMQTSIPHIYAAGDVAQSKGIHGGHELVFTWYSAVSQGWAAGCNMVGQKMTCVFRPVLSALKEIEFPVVSIGSRGSGEYHVLSRKDEKAGIFENVYIRNDVMDCYQAIGVRDKVGLFYSLITNRKKLSAPRSDLVMDHFNASHFIV